MKAEYWHGLDYYRPDNTHHALVIGAGHIGSYVAYYLARLGVKKITVIDFDHVEANNLPHQFLSEEYVKNIPEEQKIPKVEVLKHTIDFMVVDNNVEYINGKIEDHIMSICAGTPPTVIFSCVDKMTVRRFIFDSFKNYNCLFVDVRTGGTYVNVYSCSPNYYEYYDNSLHTDEEALPLPCTGTAIIDVAVTAAGEAVNRFRLHSAGMLYVQHTFHDYSVGISYPMLYSQKPTPSFEPSEEVDPETYHDRPMHIEDVTTEHEYEDEDESGHYEDR